MKTVIIKDVDYNVWHEKMSMPIGDRIAKAAAVGEICGCGEELCIDNMDGGGFCIGIIGFNRGICKRVVCQKCYMSKINCPFCQIKAEDISWTIVGGVKKSEVKSLKFSVSSSTKNKNFNKKTTVMASTPQTGGTTCEKLTPSPTRSMSRPKLQSPSVTADRLLIGTSAVESPKLDLLSDESVNIRDADDIVKNIVFPEITNQTDDDNGNRHISSLTCIPLDVTVNQIIVKSPGDAIIPSVSANQHVSVSNEADEISMVAVQDVVLNQLVLPLKTSTSSDFVGTDNQSNEIEDTLTVKTVRFESPLKRNDENLQENRFILFDCNVKEIRHETTQRSDDLDVSIASEESRIIPPDELRGMKKDDEYGQKKPPDDSCLTKLQSYYCGSSLRENCLMFKKPLSGLDLVDCARCEECMIEYICQSCFYDNSIRKCFICILDSSNIEVHSSPKTIDNNFNIESIVDQENTPPFDCIDVDDAYVTDSEQKWKHKNNNTEDILKQKLRKSSIIASVNAKVISSSNDKSDSFSTIGNVNHFKIVTDLSQDQSDDEVDPSQDNTRVMLQIGKAGHGNGVIQGYQSDIDCLRSDLSLSDRLKYMTSTCMDHLTTYYTDKFPLTNGKDIVLPLPSWWWQIISGPDTTYSAFLGGKTLKEIREFFFYRLVQFDVFYQLHISTVAITNLHSLMSTEFHNIPIREKPEILCMDTLDGYHDYDNFIAPLVIKFLLYTFSLITEMDKEITIPELQLSQNDIDIKIAAIHSIPVRKLATRLQKKMFNCGIGAFENKMRLGSKFLEFLKDSIDNISNSSFRKRKNNKKVKKTTKSSFPEEKRDTTPTDDVEERRINIYRSLNTSFSQVWDVNWSCSDEEMVVYRLFYHCFLLKQSQIYLFYEPLDNKSFVMTDKMKEDHRKNMKSLETSTKEYESVVYKYFEENNDPNTDINSETAKHIMKPVSKTWTVNGINFLYIAGAFENYTSHLEFVDGLDTSMQPKNRVYNCLPWDYKDWPVYYSFGMWGAMKLGDKIFFSKCMYRNNETGELFYGARLLTTMCISPVSKMLTMDKFMSQISFIDEKIVRQMQPLIYTQPDKLQFERRVAEQTKSAKIVYVHDAGFKRKTKYYFLPDNEIVDSERRDPNLLFDKDHVDLEGMRDREAFNCYITAMETQFGSVAQTEDSNGNIIRKSMRYKQKRNIIDLVDENNSYDKKKTVDETPTLTNIDNDNDYDDNDETVQPSLPKVPSSSNNKRGSYNTKRKQAAINDNSKETSKSSHLKTKITKKSNDNSSSDFIQRSTKMTTPVSENIDINQQYDDYNDYGDNDFINSSDNHANLHLEKDDQKQNNRANDNRSVCSNLSINSSNNNNTDNSKISKINSTVSMESMMENILKSVQQSVAEQQSEFMAQQIQKEKVLKEQNEELQNKLNQVLSKQSQNKKVTKSSDNVIKKKIFKRPIESQSEQLHHHQKPPRQSDHHQQSRQLDYHHQQPRQSDYHQQPPRPSDNYQHLPTQSNYNQHPRGIAERNNDWGENVNSNNRDSAFQTTINNNRVSRQQEFRNIYNNNNSAFNYNDQQDYTPDDQRIHRRNPQLSYDDKTYPNRHYTPNRNSNVDSIMGLFYESRNESLMQQLEQRNFERKLQTKFNISDNNW